MVLDTLGSGVPFGRDNRTGITVGLASVILAICCYGLIEYVFAQAEFLHVAVLFVIFVLGGGAAGSSYWNNGLVLSWVFVFVPTFGLTCALFIQRSTWFVEDLLLPFAWSAIAAGLVGTVGYGIGRGLHNEEDLGKLPQILVGETNLLRLGVSSAFSMGVSGFIMFLSHARVMFLEPSITVPILIPIASLSTPVTAAAAILTFWVLLAGAIGYMDYPLVDCWSILFGAFFGAASVHFVLGNISGWSVPLNLIFAFLAASAHSLVVGGSGYLLGYSIQQYQKRTN